MNLKELRPLIIP